MNYTGIEQSKKLLELGLKPETADCFYDLAEPDDRRKPIVGRMDEYEGEEWFVPCWSVGALIGLLPERIPYKVDNQTHALLDIQKNSVAYVAYGWDNEVVFETGRKDLIDCLVETFEWLLQNKYI